MTYSNKPNEPQPSQEQAAKPEMPLDIDLSKETDFKGASDHGAPDFSILVPLVVDTSDDQEYRDALSVDDGS